MNNRIVSLATTVVSIALFAVAVAPARADLLPSRSACNGQANPRADERDQERALRCLVDAVRANAGIRRVSANRALERAAGRKSKDLIRCGFTHTACGRPADAWAKHFGYDSASSWSWGENLAAGRRMTARDAVRSWLNSSSHRGTMLRGSFEHAGAAMSRRGGRVYWVLELGCHGC